MDIRGEEKVSKYVEGFFNSISSIRATDINQKTLSISGAVSQVVEKIKVIKNRNRSMFFVGNGGSASIASHQATDFVRSCQVKTFAPLDGALLTCMANDYEYENVFSETLSVWIDLQGMNILIAISSSGKSKNILNAVKIAKDMGCFIVTLSGFSPSNPLREMGDINFCVPSGSYRNVESAHLFICNMILDFTVKSLES